MAGRALVPMMALLLLAGCAGDDSGNNPPESVTAGFERGGLSDVIVVSATDRLPLRSAVLVGPGDERLQAYSLDVSSSPIQPMSLGEAQLMLTPGMPHQATRLGAMVSRALIRPADPSQYAANWHAEHIELHFGDPGGDERSVTLPAPQPP
jgi:hypothetical protein